MTIRKALAGLFLSSFLTGCGAEPIAPDGSTAAAEGSLDGLYVGLSLRPFGTAPAQMPNPDYVGFFPDGAFVWWLPQEGLDGFDRARSMEQHPTFWGTYQVQGGEVHLRFNSGASLVASRGDRGGLTIPSRATLFPVAKLDGCRLSGTYVRADGDAFFRFSPITFWPNGTFVDGGAMGQVGLSAPGGQFVTVAPGQGTYQVANNTLTLAYTDGRVLRVAIFAAGDPTESIHLNRYLLARQR
jgi:hypothetical protein